MVHEAVIERVGPEGEGRCLDVLTLAFSADPPTRWLWPDATAYVEAFPRFARALGGGAFDAGDAWHAAYAGAALWLRPGNEPDEETLVELVGETVSPDRLDAAFDVLEQMGAWHPREPHWYLPLIGVDPARQGRGIGAALLRPALRRCDEEGIPAYLEATSEGSVRLYRRLGFQPLTAIQAADAPPIVPMLRRPH